MMIEMLIFNRYSTLNMLKQICIGPWSVDKCIWECLQIKASAAYICLTLLSNWSIEANSVDPDQTAPTGAVLTGSTLFVKKAPKAFQQMIKWHFED